MIRRSIAAFVLAAALSVAGCQATNVADGTQRPRSTAEAGIAYAAPGPDDTTKPAADTDNAPARVRLTDAELDPGRLLDITGTDVSHILGDPGFVRREASARVWQYTVADCVLDVFLYDEASGYRVVYYEFRPMAGQDISELECFEAMLRRQLQGGSTARRSTTGGDRRG